MNENVEKFFALYTRDEALRRRVLDAEAMYPAGRRRWWWRTCCCPSRQSWGCPSR